MADRYPKLSEKIHSERNWLRCKEDWRSHAVELEAEISVLRAELKLATIQRDEARAAHQRYLAELHDALHGPTESSAGGTGEAGR